MTLGAQIDSYIDCYEPAIAKQFRAARAYLRKLFPRGYELVYDNYNALGIGYSYSDKSSGVVASVVAYPRWVSIFFFNGATLKDPDNLLRGSGKKIRHLVLQPNAAVGDRSVRTLLSQTVKATEFSFADKAKRVTLIKAALTHKRPRRPTRGVARAARKTKS